MLLIPDDKVKQHDSALTGDMYTKEIMNSPNEARFRNTCRMDKPTFVGLLSYLKNNGLKSGYKVSACEKLMILISIMSGNSFRQSAERFQHSTWTNNMLGGF